MTAVEWLVEQICVDVPMYNDDGNEPNIEYWNAYKSSFDLSNFINKAKEMEKEQIIDAYETSHISMMTAKQYYNETFKNK